MNIKWFAVALPIVLVLRSDAGPTAPAASTDVAPDTSGVGMLEWSYDTWTVPWVQVRGDSRWLDPASHATLMTLACETSVLERDRRARHLSPEDCEHRMAAIRADQDTALVFRVDLRVLDRSRTSEIMRLGPHVKVALEDDLGWSWTPVGTRRGSLLGMATGQKVTRVYQYNPALMRGSDYIHRDAHRVSRGRNVTAVEHWIRFPRRDPKSGERVLTPHTRWLRLRLSYGANEWVATWPFLPEEGPTP